MNNEKGKNKKGLAFLLSLCFVWCRNQDSNSGPTDYKSVALPTVLFRRTFETVVSQVGRIVYHLFLKSYSLQLCFS